MTAQVLADKYEILDVLGTGGMGVVYKARHLLMKRIVAIKMLHESLTANEVMRKRFEQEAQAISALNHPNILTVYDFGVTEDNKPYLVVEFLEGTSLEEVLNEEGALESARVEHIFEQATSGLAQAHEKGIIHRDLKPGNIMLITVGDQKDFVKIVDFGIAKLVQESTEQNIGLTATGEVFGSPLYMSPEQCRGRKLDPRSDIYSLGCVMYHSLCGKRPFNAQDLPECLYKQVHETPPKFSEVAPELAIPEGLEKVVNKAMAKEPKDRFDNMTDFKQAIDAVEAGTPLELSMPPSKPTGTTTVISTEAHGVHITAGAPKDITGNTVVPEQSTPAQTATPKAAGPQSFTKNKKLIGIAIAAAVIVIGGGVAYLATNSPTAQYETLMKEGKAAFATHNYHDAEVAFQNAINVSAKFGEDSAQRNEAVDELGQMYMNQKKYDKLYQLATQTNQVARCIASFSKELDALKKQGADRTAQAADLLQLLGKLSEKEGDFTRAEGFYTEALTIRKEIANLATQAEAVTAKVDAAKKTPEDKVVKKAAQEREIKSLSSHITQVHRQKILHPKPIAKTKPVRVNPFPTFDVTKPITITPSAAPVEVKGDDKPQSAADKPKKRGFFSRLFHHDKSKKDKGDDTSE
jgi:eukaryotic-like serine/threonine-protein kinase